MTNEKNRRGLILEYFNIADNNYHDKVNFYERYFSEIKDLLLSDQLEIEIDYTLALFELGRYAKCLSPIQDNLESVIKENLFSLKGEDIYQKLLFKKAACHFNLDQTNKSIGILSQLLRMDPENKTYRSFYKKCYRGIFMLKYRWIGGLAIGLLLLAAFIISIELLVIRPFYYNHTYTIEILRSTLFVISTSMLLLRELSFMNSINKQLERNKQP